jgi:hypothetical protein
MDRFIRGQAGRTVVSSDDDLAAAGVEGPIPGVTIALIGGSALFVLPFDRAANRRLLLSRRHTAGRNRTHGLD